jgi:hypothetical protein
MTPSRARVWQIAVPAGVVCTSEVILGRFFGFSSLGDHLVWWALAGSLLVASLRVAAWLSPTRASADVAVRAGVVAFGLVVLWGLLLGSAHLLGRPWYVAAGVLTGLAVVLTRWPRSDLPSEGQTRLPVVLVAVMVAMGAFVVGTGIGHSPWLAYDSLSYHLFFPARWLQAQHLFVIPTPFSDEAQAYQPVNGELWFLFLMVPFHGDLLARIGQFPFYMLAAVSAYALARRLGVTAAHAMYAPALLSIAPVVVDQAVGANVDLIFAAMFLASLCLGIDAAERNTRRDWALWGVAVGLFLGTKYLALVYLPAALLVPFVRRVRRRALWAVPGVVAFGAVWYVRNWVLAGSPTYPASLSLAGIAIGHGAYSRHAMLQSYAHATSVRLLVVSLVHAFGTPFFFVAGPGAVIALLAVAARRAWWPAACVVLTTVASVLLCWIGLGDNTDSRFLLPATGLTVSLLPLSFGRQRWANAVLHGLYTVGIVWVLVGRDLVLPISVPWYMQDWLSLHGVVSRSFLVRFGLLALGTAGIWSLLSKRGWAVPAAGVVLAAGGVTLAIGAETWCVPSRCDFLQITPSYVRQDFVYGARWVAANVSGTAVAYTGINLPYPLSGTHLVDVVHYVNIDDHAEWRFHDYARWFSRQPSSRTADAPLARGSGLLAPATERDGRLDALRPRFERMYGDRGAWERNLKARQIGYVFVSRLDPYEIDYVWHTAQGFPIEDEWARTDPAGFRLVYENPGVRVYMVTTP